MGKTKGKEMITLLPLEIYQKRQKIASATIPGRFVLLHWIPKSATIPFISTSALLIIAGVALASRGLDRVRRDHIFRDRDETDTRLGQDFETDTETKN